jgi:hypothetical protein
MTSKLASVIFPILLMTPLTGVAQQYTATDIGTLGGSTVSGTGKSCMVPALKTNA